MFFLVIADYPSQDGVYGKQDYGKYNSYRKVHWSEEKDLAKSIVYVCVEFRREI